VNESDRELLLLLACRLGLEGQERVRGLLGRVESWPWLLFEASRHGVYPLVQRNLASVGDHRIPERVMGQLAAVCRRNVARNALLVRELTQVLGILDRAGVPAIPLKGVALADLLYHDITLRVCSDVDVLVPRHAVSAAVAVLRTEGYLPEDELWASSSEKELVLDSDIEAAFRRRVYEVAPLVDLHWDIARRWRADSKAIDDLWSETFRSTFWGVGAYRLSPEWELLYLAVHAVRHRWRALKWLVDIHDYSSTRSVDWDRLAAKADGLGWGRALRLSLGLCRALLGTAVPEALAPEAPPWVLAQLHGSGGEWKDSLIPARVLDRRADRLRYVFRLLLLPTIMERRVVRLPTALSVVYYLLRPLRLATRWGKPIAISTLRAWRSAIRSGEYHGGGDDNEPRGLGSSGGACDSDPARLTGIGARSRRVGAGPQGEPVPEPTVRV